MTCPYEPQEVCSRSISVAECGLLWRNAGGSETNIVTMVAIAVAESCLDPLATSPVCALGLWQIYYAHAAEYGVGIGDLYNVDENARIAVSLSQNGSYLSPWDVAYANVQRAAQRYPLHELEQGSPAANFVPMVQQGLQMGGPAQGSGGGTFGSSGPGQTPAAPSPQPPNVSPPQRGATYPPAVSLPLLPELHEGGDRIGDWENMRSFIGYDLTYFWHHLNELKRILLKTNPAGG